MICSEGARSRDFLPLNNSQRKPRMNILTFIKRSQLQRERFFVVIREKKSGKKRKHKFKTLSEWISFKSHRAMLWRCCKFCFVVSAAARIVNRVQRAFPIFVDDCLLFTWSESDSNFSFFFLILVVSSLSAQLWENA